MQYTQFAAARCEKIDLGGVEREVIAEAERAVLRRTWAAFRAILDVGAIVDREYDE